MVRSVRLPELIFTLGVRWTGTVCVSPRGYLYEKDHLSPFDTSRLKVRLFCTCYPAAGLSVCVCVSTASAGPFPYQRCEDIPHAGVNASSLTWAEAPARLSPGKSYRGGRGGEGRSSGSFISLCRSQCHRVPARVSKEK